MKREKDVRGSTLRSTSGAKPVILSGSCSIFTLSEMKHQRNSYNDNKVEIAIWSVYTILGTPECLNTIPLAEMAQNRTFNFSYRSSALVTYTLTWGDRLNRTDMVRHTTFSLTPKKHERTSYKFISSSRTRGSEKYRRRSMRIPIGEPETLGRINDGEEQRLRCSATTSGWSWGPKMVCSGRVVPKSDAQVSASIER
jgi:hypothetical protein